MAKDKGAGVAHDDGEKSRPIAAFLNRNCWAVRGGVLFPQSKWIPSVVGSGAAVEETPVADYLLAASPAFSPLNRSVLNKAALNKNKSGMNKSVLNKNKRRVSETGQMIDNSLLPALQLRRLHQGTTNDGAPLRRFVWEGLDLPAPPGPDYTRFETERLLEKQLDVQERERRRPDIIVEASLDLSAFTRPLGIDGQQGYSATENVFYTILSLCEYVGLIYKDRFGRARPNQFEPRLRPMLPNPAHLSYPSNHAFQSFSIVLCFTTLLPEHPATAELFRIAKRVAENREWAGLHYASDTAAGKELARRFLPYLVEVCADDLAAAREEWL